MLALATGLTALEGQAQPTAKTAPAVPAGAGLVLIRADRQSYDRQLGRVVASGHVEVTLNGWRLLADRLEFAEASRSLVARGQVRLQKGDQYLQASSLRYSDWEGSGELLDVYGVIDRDTLPAALRTNQASEPARSDASSDTSGDVTGDVTGAAPGFVCPPLQAPPDRPQLPTIAAPPGCPGADPSGGSLSLTQSLEATAMGPGLQPGPDRPIAAPAPGDSRVSDVSYQQSLSAAIKVDLGPLLQTNNTSSSGGGIKNSFEQPRGEISRLRFQSSRLTLRGDRWDAAEVAFTNDPYTPAASWTIAQQVEAIVEPNSKTTTITARRTRILLNQRISLPGLRKTTIGSEKSGFAIDSDNRDRDGWYIGYNLSPIQIGTKGTLQLQPQFLLQRAIEGQTDSYIAPGSSLGSPTITQKVDGSDLFGLDGILQMNLAGMQFNAELSLSTFNPKNIPGGTRSGATLSRSLGLSWAPDAAISLFSGYRERVYNGSLGLQNLIYGYGARLNGGSSIPLSSQPSETVAASGIRFSPLQYSWELQSGNYQANLYQSDALATLWRSNLNLSASTTLQLWQGQPVYDGEGIEGMRYSPSPIVPGLGLEMGVSGTLATYSDNASQNTLTLWGGPALTLGRFDRPWFDYTRLSVTVGGTLLDGGSPFGFDRAVDLRTLNFKAAQQIYGPLVLEGGASFNIDPGSTFYGEASYTYLEVKLQRRSYEFGIYYSPYEGIGGVRLKLHDFNFTGTGTPFVPRPAS